MPTLTVRSFLFFCGSNLQPNSAIESVPLDLQRDLSLIKELDGHTNQFMDQINEKMEALKECSFGDESFSQNVLAVDTLLDLGIKRLEEKALVASKAYEALDKQVKRLDDDLTRFEYDYGRFLGNTSMLMPMNGAIDGSLHMSNVQNAAGTNYLQNAEFSHKRTRTALKEESANVSNLHEAAFHSQSSIGAVSRRNGKPLRKAADRSMRKLSGNLAADDFEAYDASRDLADTEESAALPYDMRATQSASAVEYPPQVASEYGFEASADTAAVVKLPSIENLAGMIGGGSNSISRAASPLDFGMNSDPNEPKYCYCNQVSYGEMIACDNENVSDFNFQF